MTRDIRPSLFPLAFIKEALITSGYKASQRKHSPTTKPEEIQYTQVNPLFLDTGLRAWKYKSSCSQCYVLSTKDVNLKEAFKTISDLDIQPSLPVEVNLSHQRSGIISNKSVYVLTDSRYNSFGENMLYYSLSTLSDKLSDNKLDDQDILRAARYINHGMLALVESSHNEKFCKRAKYAMKRVLAKKKCHHCSDLYPYTISIVEMPQPRRGIYQGTRDTEAEKANIIFLYDSNHGKEVFFKCLSNRIKHYSKFKPFEDELNVYHEEPVHVYITK